jgi:ketosteroid isomerase-like protein
VETDPAVFAAAARALDEAFIRYANAGELERLVGAYYADDALVLPPNAPPVRGRGQIRELFREMMEAGAHDMTRETSELHVAGDLGYGIGIYRLVLRPPGEDPIRDSGKYMLAYRRQPDGTWKVAADTFSSDLPSPARR